MPKEERKEPTQDTIDWDPPAQNPAFDVIDAPTEIFPALSEEGAERFKRREEQQMEMIKKRVHIYSVNLWGLVTLIFSAPSKECVLNYVKEHYFIGGIPPKKLEEHILELPAVGLAQDKATLLCQGISGLDETRRIFIYDHEWWGEKICAR